MFSLPMDAGRDDLTVGRDELGRPVRRSLFGHEYGEAYADDPAEDRRRMVAQALMEAAQRGEPFEPGLVGMGEGPGAGGVIGGLVQGAIEGFTAPGRAARGEPVTLGEAWATALDGYVPGVGASVPEGALRSGGGKIRAYHGSPHDFDRFDMSKIGTGTGQTVQGRGLYFAENMADAERFRDQTYRPTVNGQSIYASSLSDDAQEIVWNYMRDKKFATGADLANFAKADLDARANVLPFSARRHYQNIIDEFNEMPDAKFNRPGGVYEVEISASPEDFLSYDEFVAKGASVDSDDFSRAIKQSGAPGLRYRGSGGDNFVVFDDSLIEIVRKYGIAGAAMLTGMTAAEIQAGLGDAQAAGETQADAIRQYLQGAQ